MPSKHAPKAQKESPVPETPASAAPEGSDSGADGGRNFVPADEFKTFQAMIEGQLSALSANLGAVLSRPTPSAQAPAPQPQVPQFQEPSDDEIEEAMSSGKGAAMMRRLAQIEAAKREAQLLQQHINPLRETGVSALVNLTKTAAKGRLPLYGKYEKEIDGLLSELPVDSLTNPQVYDVAYAKVVSDHLDEIISERVKAAAGLAEEAAATDPIASVFRPARTTETTGEKIPSVEELCGPDAAQALKSRNQSPDAFARQLGYTDWAAYAKVAKSFEEQ